MMNKKKALETASTEALEFARRRRIDVVEVQESEIIRRDFPVFTKITKRISDSEKRLVAFVTKFLSIDAVLDAGILEGFIL